MYHRNKYVCETSKLLLMLLHFVRFISGYRYSVHVLFVNVLAVRNIAK